MVEDKLLRVKQRPEHIVEHLLWRGAGFAEGFQLGQLLRAGLTAQAAEIQVRDDLFRRLAALEQRLDHAALLDLVLNRVAVEQVQGLRKIRIHLHLARANRRAAGAAKRGEEIIRRVAVGYFHRLRSARQAGELVLRLGDLADAVEQIGRASV